LLAPKNPTWPVRVQKTPNSGGLFRGVTRRGRGGTNSAFERMAVRYLEKQQESNSLAPLHTSTKTVLGEKGAASGSSM